MKADRLCRLPDARKAKAKVAKASYLRARLLLTYIEACGIAPSKHWPGSLGAGVGLWESAEVRAATRPDRSPLRS